jgi:Ni,Fe-hydrogenase III small subunit
MPLKEFSIFLRHGSQYVRDLRNAVLPGVFRGRPVISSGITDEETRRVAEHCPAGAIGTDPCSIDLGRCVFCGECQFMVPGKIIFTNDYRLATDSREGLIIRAGEDRALGVDPAKVRPEVRKLFRHALKLRQVSAGGDNSAEMELNAAGNVNFDMGRYGIEFVASPRHADGLVVTGPVSASMARALLLTWEAIPAPKILVLAGSDAISGGIFSDSPAIDRSFPGLSNPDLYIPGNPPHPLTFINGVRELTSSG